MLSFNVFYRWRWDPPGELEYHFLLSRDLHFLNDATYDRVQIKVVEVKRMLAGLIRKVDAERRS
jgi:four helix bundle protein